jgi:hypothetical protein
VNERSAARITQQSIPGKRSFWLSGLNLEQGTLPAKVEMFTGRVIKYRPAVERRRDLVFMSNQFSEVRCRFQPRFDRASKALKTAKSFEFFFTSNLVVTAAPYLVERAAQKVDRFIVGL